MKHERLYQLFVLIFIKVEIAFINGFWTKNMPILMLFLSFLYLIKSELALKFILYISQNFI